MTVLECEIPMTVVNNRSKVSGQWILPKQTQVCPHVFMYLTGNSSLPLAKLEFRGKELKVSRHE